MQRIIKIMIVDFTGYKSYISILCMIIKIPCELRIKYKIAKRKLSDYRVWKWMLVKLFKLVITRLRQKTRV